MRLKEWSPTSGISGPGGLSGKRAWEEDPGSSSAWAVGNAQQRSPSAAWPSSPTWSSASVPLSARVTLSFPVCSGHTQFPSLPSLQGPFT